MGSPRIRCSVWTRLLALGLAACGIAGGSGSAMAAVCPDADLDGYADCSVPGCDPTGLVCGDCDDGDGEIHPGASEVCDHRDDDCDRLVDEGFTQMTARQGLLDRHPAASDRYGTSLASIGDVNSDGVPDFVVGNLADDLGASEGGSVTLYSGVDRRILCRATGATGDNLGVSVAATGDMNGDRIPDFAGSEPTHDAVAVFSGADCSPIARCVDSATSVANLGGDHGLAGFVDVTGDGIPEILAGADHSGTLLHYGGRAVVFTVSASGACTVLRTLDDPDLAIYSYLGYAVSGLADVTGDGVADIAVGESGYANYAGCVLIFSGAGGTFVRRIVDPAGASNDHLGESLATIQCLDGDGIRELVVGSPRNSITGSADAGHVLVFSPEDGVVRRDIIHADGGTDWLGWALAALPDLNGDGIDEIVAGARYADTAGGADAGKAVILSPADGSEIRELVDEGGAAGDALGYSVASAGDLSGDGIAEILVGAPFDDGAAGVDQGSVSIFGLESDCDGDGRGPFGGDCDDADADVWSLPGEARSLVLAADRRSLSWDPPLDSGNSSGAVLYDVLRSSSPGGFGSAECLEQNDTDLTAQDPVTPGAGVVFHYLCRAQNSCGEGGLGHSSSGDARVGRTCP
jgi:hypothetical protein